MQQSTVSFPTTRETAWSQLQEFLPRVPVYGQTRSAVQPGHAGVSRLSPALAARLITEDEILTQTLARFPAAQAEKWLQEVFWRRYWKGWLEQHPGLWALYRRRVGWLRENIGSAVVARAEAVVAGRSGVALMDRFARELVATGYLHNHARMWWASFWVHVEKLPWELGADFFLRHLLDADAASNTLSWRWVAGLQTRNKTYLVRRSNLERHCAPEWLADRTGLERLGDDAAKAVLPEFPEPGEDEPEAIDWGAEERAANKTERFASHPSKPPELEGRCGLWIHPEDATPELGNLGTIKPVSVLAGSMARGSEAQSAYRQAVLSDALRRAEGRYGIQGLLATDGTLTHRLTEWARANQLATVCAMAPAVGPIADELPAIRAGLKEAGVELLLLRRHTDFELWPHARAGFFPFWESAQLWIKAKQKRGELPKGG